MIDRYAVPVLSIDPGPTTGWVLGQGTNVIAQSDDDSWTFMFWFGKVADQNISRVVIERFDLRQLTKDAAVTVEQIGAIKFICRLYNIPWVEHNASDKKKFIDTARQYTRTTHAADAEALRLYDLEYGVWDNQPSS